MAIVASRLTLNQRKIATPKLVLTEQNARFLMQGDNIILDLFSFSLKNKKGFN